MTLTGTNGRSFDLSVTGYQFPDVTDDDYDSNWLCVTIKLEGFGKAWTADSPSLMTWELRTLADWFKQILIGTESHNEIRFIEPNLIFQLIYEKAGIFLIRTTLSLESKPDWYDESSFFTFDLDVDKNQIQNSINSLEYQLVRFPGRGGIVIR